MKRYDFWNVRNKLISCLIEINKINEQLTFTKSQAEFQVCLSLSWLCVR